MAPKEKKTTQQKPKTDWFLACFGFHHRKTVVEKKGKKGGGRKRWFKLCMPRIKVIVIRKKKVSFDAKTAAIKATQNMIVLEATKVRQYKLKHAKITQQTNYQQIESNNNNNNNDDLQSPRDELDVATLRNQEQTTTTTTTTTMTPTVDKVTKDSLAAVSILVITLLIMSICGRLCAVLCMSAWLYFVPILKVYKDTRPNLVSIKIDNIASRLYKKKTMLKGLLQRDNKIGIGVS